MLLGVAFESPFYNLAAHTTISRIIQIIFEIAVQHIHMPEIAKVSQNQVTLTKNFTNILPVEFRSGSAVGAILDEQ